MNKIFFFVMVVLTITISSCTSESELRTFTYAEMQTLIAMEVAVRTTDSLYLQDLNEKTLALPIVRINDIGYYPIYEDVQIIYYPVKYE